MSGNNQDHPQNQETPEQQGSFGTSLRALVHQVVRSGTTYSQIRDIVGADWTESALKKFANRTTQPRINSKTLALARFAVERTRSFQDEDLAKDIKIVSDVVSGHSQGRIAPSAPSLITERFAQTRDNGTNHSLPDRFAFCRFGRSKNHLILILVNTRKTEKGHHMFTMKISGAKGRRRVVTGFVLSTGANTYLTGLAHPLMQSLTDDEFHNLDPLNPAQFALLLNPVPVGLEHLAIANHWLSDQIPAISFSGLDGSGFPISGIGALVREDFFGRFHIKEQVFSDVVCSEQTKYVPLANCLKQLGGATRSPLEAPVI